MLNKIIQFSLKNKLIVILMVFGLIVYGGYSLTQLPIDAVPDITNNQVMVITSSPSLSAPDMERFITVPIEQGTRNIPGIKEQRSFSRFGLSIVTIVFDESTDVYWARQQVSDRLNEIKEEIPVGMGTPTLGPVSSGLGEVYQYVIRPLPGYEKKYDLTTLREIQDWTVRRQLLGTEGVADVSSLGGNLKQYEVAISPEKLKSYGLTIDDIFLALNNNNQNAGGAYIEKGPQTLFIRSEGLVGTINDIGKIVVTRHNGVPILVRDVANVHIGHAIKYGAMVYNGESEVAGAVVMMLKGENSSKVIKNIKTKIAEIQKKLPEGLKIDAFLDRTKMVNNAIGTVEHNLTEGALIVVLVLVLFLGNIRAGLIVASVIPLAMLFAIIMMNIFGVSGNLMSLGALDFGMIVDGAVIIVEAVMHHIRYSSGYKESMKLSGVEMDKEVGQASSRMMHSAAFGQIIILIVYLPILSLQGIEGKMFRPMAQTVAFAIIGAFLLSLTYIPVMTSLVLSKKVKHRDSISDRIVGKIIARYRIALQSVLRYAKVITVFSFIVFGFAVYVLSTLGGEFIPQLEEGDFAVETRLLSGASLTRTMEVISKTAALLKSKFPEVEQVVCKIGSGEIPTDPMPMNAGDMIIKLKPKSEWKSAKSFPELADKMTKVLSDVPEVATGFSFPVQMRFNELMTGSKQDVVCKIFGDNLDSLSIYNDKLMSIIRTLDGAKDWYEETVTGIAQMVVTYNRDAIARYGANIADINRTLQTAYAGATAGLVFENDRRFDLVLRMNNQQKSDVKEIGNLLVSLPDGNQIPLEQLAAVHLQDGPYQIQREDARRRITAGFNVRGRDVQSIVEELQSKVKQQLQLPAGYDITYGGDYENLQHATKRLTIAVPIALLLIFLMLFFAFQELRLGALIFSAIPLSIIGGVFALWWRDMPFSISAGVGFIALFGVAVLNGIVMIGEMTRLRKEEGMTDLHKVVMSATTTRLRPVLMTACVASFGFLPMALSNGAGAEVQRPLATVVIGGLVTATLLTLFVLPGLYLLVESRIQNKINRKMKSSTIVSILIVALLPLGGQAQKISLQDALMLAHKNNLQLNVNRLQERYYEMMAGTASQVPKTQVTADLGQINSYAFDNKIVLAQSLPFFSVYKKEKQVLLDEWTASRIQTELQRATIDRYVRIAYLQLQHLDAKESLLVRMDSLYSRMLVVAALRHTQGESTILEKTTLENEVAQIRIQEKMLYSDKVSAQVQMGALINQNIVPDALDSLSDQTNLFDTSNLESHPYLQYLRQQQVVAKSMTAAEKAKLTPDLLLGYTNQSFVGWQTNIANVENYNNWKRRFNSGQIGVALPLFNSAQKNRIKASQLNEKIAEANIDIAQQQLSTQLKQSIEDYKKSNLSVGYFKSDALPHAQVIIENASKQYSAGEINYLDWVMLMRNALNIENQYIEQLNALQASAIQLQYLLFSGK